MSRFFTARAAWLVLLGLLFSAAWASSVRAQEAWTDSDDTATLSSWSEDPGHWEDQGWWDRNSDEEWYYTEYWVWVPDSKDKYVTINDETVFVSAQNQCVSADSGCLAWGPQIIQDARRGAVITGDFVLYHASGEGTITWGIRGDGVMTWSGPGLVCGRCRWTLVAGVDNPRIYILWWGHPQSFKVAMENVKIISNPEPPPEREVVKREHSDRMRQAADNLDILADVVNVASAKCASAPPRYAVLCGVLVNGASIAFRRTAESLRRADPWDPDYGSTAYPDGNFNPGIFGTDWDYSGDALADAYNNYLWWMLRVRMVLDAANQSIDRAYSCRQAGAGCFDDRANEAQAYLREAGEGMANAAYWLDRVTEFLDCSNLTSDSDPSAQCFNPSLNGKYLLSNALDDGADWLRESYNVLSQINY